MSDTIKKEEDFHDMWAASMDLSTVMVDEFFEACTSPENKYIVQKLGSLKGKKLLELGCGAGEASVYFAKQGADVTATDLSQSMLDVVEKLGTKHGVQVTPMKSRSDKIDAQDESFDIVYAANLMHHVDIEDTLVEAKRVLKKDGFFVSWDPLAHNPLINIYRKIATEFRTEDEHPLTMSDIEIFSKHFSTVDAKFFWFTTLLIFLKFYLVESVNPNKERYWKKVIIEHKRLEKLYTRLERLDHQILRWFPFFKKYCWNVAFVCKK